MKQLVWFRNNLRVQDNTPLLHAIATSTPVIAMYCFDPRHYQKTEFGFPKTGVFRAKFLIETITDLQANLKKLNIPLVLFLDKPETIISQLVQEYAIQGIYSETEWTAEEVLVTTEVKNNIPPTVVWNEFYDQFLFHPDDIPYTDFSKIPRVFTEFRKKCERYVPIREALTSFDAQEIIVFNTSKKQAQTTSVPTLADLKLSEPAHESRTAFPFAGGETTGMQRLQEYIWDTQNIATYKQTRNQLIGTAYSSKFSAWLANGSISARTIYWEVKKFEEKVLKNQDTYWMIFELIWRDFFKFISLKHGDKLFKIGGILEKQYSWEVSEEKKQQWITGTTKYDFVNANMNELAKTGWMSNRGRQNVASFWAKELQQDWRIGASYFESLLIDYDVHSNWGNWQYVSGVGNDPRDRKFNIERQAANYDPDKAYVKLWL